MKQLLIILSLLITFAATAQVDQATSSVFTQGDLAQRVGTKDGVQMKVGGLATIGDGGGGTFRWDANSTAFPIPGRIIQPVIGGVPQATGRWLLVLQAQESIAGLSDSLANIRNSKGGGGGTTIINNGSSRDTSIQIVATGSTLDIPINVGDSATVTSLQNTTINGGGAYTFRQVGNSVIIHYTQAPEGSIIYKISLIGFSSTAKGGGPIPIPDTIPVTPGGGGGAGNSAWTYVIDTSCQINLGALFSLSSPSANMIALANTGLPFARVSYNGSGTVNYPTYTAGGYRVLLSVNPSAPVAGSYTALPTDSLTYRNNLKSLINTNGKTNLIGIAGLNEWNNIKHGAGYWNPGSAKNMINLLRAGGNAAHELGLPYYDGGVTGDILRFLVYEDYNNRGFADSATAFAARAFPAGTVLTNWRTDTAHGYRVKYTDSVLTAMQTLPLDGVNIHWKETVVADDSTDATINPLTFVQVVRYLHRKTGKPVITNEIAADNNTNADILSQLMDAVQDLHDAKNGDMSLVFWYAADADHAIANADGSLTDYGLAFKQKIAETHIDQ